MTDERAGGAHSHGTPDARADAYSRDHGIQHVYWSTVTCYVAAAETLRMASLRSSGSR
jgi:hypothetical protein